MISGGRSLGARALLALISADPMSRDDLAEHLGLSMTATTYAVRPLIEAGLIEEQPPMEVAGPGRPTRLLVVVLSSTTVTGIELTDDRLYAVLIDPLGEVLVSGSRPLTDAGAGSVTVLIALVVAQLAERSGRRPDTIGISLGAATVGRQIVVAASFLGWCGVPLAAMVSEATGFPCVTANGVRVFAYAEAWFGAGHGKDPSVMVALGTGTGCRAAVAGEVVSGAQSAASSAGHLPVDPPGPNCEIGHLGCARALALAPGILRVATEHLEYEANEPSPDLLLNPDMRRHNGVDDILRCAVLAIGRVVGTLVAYTDPEFVVISGEGVAMVETCREVFDEEVGSLRH